MMLFPSVSLKRAYAALSLAFLIFPTSTTAEAEQGEFTYVVDETTVLDTLGGGGAPTAINEKGQIVGLSRYRAGGLPHAVLWEGDSVEDLSLGIPGFQSVATDINNHGEIVGHINREYDPADLDHDFSQAFHFFEGTWTNLSEGFPEANNGLRYPSLAHAINDQGVIVGGTWFEYEKPNGSGIQRRFSAARWYAHDYPNYAFFETLDSFEALSVGTDVNEQDIAVGFERERFNPGQGHSRFYNEGNGQNETFIEPREQRYDSSCHWSLTGSGLAINDNNWVVGATRHNGSCHAARFQATGPPILLNSTGGEDFYSRAKDANNHNMIVGHLDAVPVVWPENGGMIKLPMLGHTNGSATGINDYGEIVGYVYSDTSEIVVPVLWRLTTKQTQPLGRSPSDDKADAQTHQKAQSETRAVKVGTESGLLSTILK